MANTRGPFSGVAAPPTNVHNGSVSLGRRRRNRSFEIRQGLRLVEDPIPDVQRTYGSPTCERPLRVTADAQACGCE